MSEGNSNSKALQRCFAHVVMYKYISIKHQNPCAQMMGRGFAFLIFVDFAAVSACDSDLNCSLNGICTNGACKCDSPWSGESCGLLSRAPSPAGGIYGYATNVTSWGGNIIQKNNTWHLFVAEMAGKGCGLHVWGKQSTVVHATSKTLAGPVVAPIYAYT